MFWERLLCLLLGVCFNFAVWCWFWCLVCVFICRLMGLKFVFLSAFDVLSFWFWFVFWFELLILFVFWLVCIALRFCCVSCVWIWVFIVWLLIWWVFVVFTCFDLLLFAIVLDLDFKFVFLILLFLLVWVLVELVFCLLYWILGFYLSVGWL